MRQPTRNPEAPTIPGLGFEPLVDAGEHVYSVRLNQAYRAHLRKVPSSPGWLQAFRVGSHKSMGHG